MIEVYRGLAIFVTIVDAGSFSAAGRHLRLSTSVVSHHISKLEEQLAVSLFFRSTRSLRLTAEGKAILESARQMVASATEAIDIVAETNESPVGALRISMPAFGDNNSMHQGIWAFAKKYPNIAISTYSSDRPVDLVKEGFDLALRLGVLSDSTLVSKKIGSFERKLVASPAYLEQFTKIETLKDLQTCSFVSISLLPDTITLIIEGQAVSFVPENVRMEVNTIASAKSAILAGLGIQHLPTSEVEQELASGDLVEISPKFQLPTLGIYALWPNSGPQKKLTRRLIDFLTE